MKNKKIAIISIIIAIIAIIGGITFYILNKQDKNTTLTILEKQWIEDNKNNVIDLSIINNIPVFNYEGKGVLFDFVDSLEKNTGLKFNKLSYNLNEQPSSAYSFKIVDKVEKNDILVYEDNYALLTKNNIKYNNITSIPTMTVGVLASDIGNVGYYLKENPNLTYKTYTDASSLIAAISTNVNGVDSIILPKTIYLKYIVENKNLNISYNITEITKSLVLRLGDTKKLNKIIKKYYTKWEKQNYEESYNNSFSSNYFTFKQIYEQEKVNFESKRYSYAFIENAPFDAMVNNRLVGTNYEIIKGFAKLTNIEISYEEYKNLDELINKFNENKVDFFFDFSSNSKYDMDVYNTVSVYNEQLVVLSSINKDITINSISSLKNYKVLTIKGSIVDEVLKTNGISTKTYNNVNDLLHRKSKSDVLVLDKAVYDIYLYKNFKNYKVDYIFNLNKDYVYTTRSIEANKVFNEYFDFYLSFINDNQYKNNIKYSMFENKITSNRGFIIVLVILLLFISGSFIYMANKLKPKKKKETISKEDKLKYIDMLTSLKNRNYLNESMSKWDSSEIYPQAIIIIDLNNVAYINDNYGHEEGDNIIKEAAGILIKNQYEKTEIMRTNGNEFLIYMVEYDEKQVVSYVRKLNKEFKELNHGFGAALGYSIITDQLKTVDDAINEATLDMKSNKEEVQN